MEKYRVYDAMEDRMERIWAEGRSSPVYRSLEIEWQETRTELRGFSVVTFDDAAEFLLASDATLGCGFEVDI